MKRWVVGIQVLSLMLYGAMLFAQSSASPGSSDSASSSEKWENNLGDEPLGVGDLIYVAVSGAPEVTRSFRVAQDGTVTLPVANVAVSVLGKTPVEAGKLIASALIEAKTFVHPIVSVSVMDYRSKRITLVGAFHLPTVIQAVGDMTLLDAITRAQGISPEASGELIVTRKGKDGVPEVLHISVHDLESGTDPALNIPLYGGEEIRLPEAARFYVLGNVKMPGAYSFGSAGDITVMKAIAMSQGAQYYSKRIAYVFRETGVGKKREMIPVPLDKIMRHKVQDVELVANDLLYIPENRAEHLSAEFVDRFTGFSSNFLSSTMSGLIVFH